MLFKIVTNSGSYIAYGEEESKAKINFTLEFPSEKIRDIKPLGNKVVEYIGTIIQ